MRTAGVDLAARPARTALAVLEWGREPPTVASATTGVPDDLVRTTLRDPSIDVIGLDVPLGWPTAFAELVAAHAQQRPLPHADRGWTEVYAELRTRVTDRWVTDELPGGPTPMSVSVDKLGAPALRAARLLDELRRDPGAPAVDRSGRTGRIVEIYPAAALASWGLPFRGYKRGEHADDVRAEIAAGLAHAVAGLDAARDDHQLDAVIGAVVAGMARSGMTRPIPDAHVVAAEREGWIHLPTADSLDRRPAD